LWGLPLLSYTENFKDLNDTQSMKIWGNYFALDCSEIYS